MTIPTEREQLLAVIEELTAELAGYREAKAAAAPDKPTYGEIALCVMQDACAAWNQGTRMWEISAHRMRSFLARDDHVSALTIRSVGNFFRTTMEEARRSYSLTTMEGL